MARFSEYSRMRMATCVRIGVLGLLLLLAGCGSLGQARLPAQITVPPDLPEQVSSLDREIGRREHPKVVAGFGGIYRDPGIEEALAELTSRLIAASDAPAQAYEVTILNSPVVNAFALPGGYIYVTRGLLALATDQSELAAVLAHEMAHVTARHAIKREAKVRNTVLAARVLQRVADTQEEAESVAKTSERTLASFSQAQELEADAAGIRTTARAGYDPYAAERFLNKLATYTRYLQSEDENREGEAMASSHPTTPLRLQRAILAARQYGAPGSVGRQDKQTYLNTIDGILYGDEPNEGYVRGQTFVHPRLRLKFSLPENFRIENTARAVFATSPDGTAIRFDGVDIPAGNGLSTYLASGWLNGLETTSIQRMRINGLEGVTALANANGWFFRVAVVRNGGAAYRFLFANRVMSPEFEDDFQNTLATFRRLSIGEAESIRPLRIRLQKVRRGDTIAKLSLKMSGVNRKERLFRIINNLGVADRLTPGDTVKIVTDR